MTTPEQLKQWREEFELQLLPATETTRDVMGKYCLNGLETQWQGYLRRCQETEQIMNLAKFGAMVLNRLGSATVPGGAEMWDMAGTHGLLTPCQSDLNEVTEATIKQLLI